MEMPSIVGRACFPILQDYEIGVRNGNYDKVSVTLDMDVLVHEKLWIDKYMDLIFICDNSNPINTKTK